MPDDFTCRICGANHPLAIFEEDGKMIAECYFHFFDCEESSWNHTLKNILAGDA